MRFPLQRAAAGKITPPRREAEAPGWGNGFPRSGFGASFNGFQTLIFQT
jgi:hypothetical protein